MGANDLSTELKKCAFSEDEANAIIHWNNDDFGMREEIYERMQNLTFRQLGDLRQALTKSNDWGKAEYWPRHYINRIATHYYDIKSSDAAATSAKAAKDAAATAETALVTGRKGLTVSILALTITTLAVVVNVFSEQRVSLQYDTQQLAGTIAEQWSVSEAELTARITALEIELQNLKSQQPAPD